MKEEIFPARLHILIAGDSDKAVIIRRGPSRHTCVFCWDRKKNTFEIGQWLKGRIYERRSDVSPSGKYWIYFAMNGKWDTDAKGAWTAIARTPWLKAVSIFPKGDCWNGGGLFLDNKTYWLNDGHGHDVKYDSSEVVRNDNYDPPGYYGGECLHVYYNRLQRDGWMLCKTIEHGKWTHETLFEKDMSRNWKLVKKCHSEIDSPQGKGCYWDEHELINEHGEKIVLPDWEWADWVDGCIYYASAGCLYKQAIKSSTILNKPIKLHDFNDYRFEEKLAPY